MNEKIQNILTEIESVIVGKNENVEKILMAILAQGHVLMEDVPGVGKTTTALTFAKVLGLDTRRVQFTSDTVPSDVIGYSVYDKSVDSFVYKPGAIMTNLLLADEINRTSSKTQSALLEAMEEHRVTVDGQTYALPTPFVVLATQNPTGSAGTTLLPSSQLDRFLIRLSMGYPDHKSQINILRDRHSENPLDRVQPVVTKDDSDWTDSDWSPAPPQSPRDSWSDASSPRILHETPEKVPNSVILTFSPRDPMMTAALPRFHNETPIPGSRLWWLLRCFLELSLIHIEPTRRS